MRSPESRKYELGNILIIGGDQTYTGAFYLAAMGAYITGVDLISMYVPIKSAEVLRSEYRFIIHEYNGKWLDYTHIHELTTLISQRKYDTIILGPGLGRHRDTARVIREILKQNIQAVIDGDATRFITSRNNSIFLYNIKEAPKVEDIRSRKGIHILKGKNDRIYSQGKRIHITRYKQGSEYLLKAGTGDLLAGVIGGFYSKTQDPLYSARMGTKIMKEIGSKLGSKYEEYYTHEDLITELINYLKIHRP